MKRVVLLLVATVALMTVPLVVSATVSPTISDVHVSPTTPAPGETVTVTPLIENLQSSTEPIRITDVAVRDAEGAAELIRVQNLGNVAPGSTVEVPLSVSFDSAGTHQLRVILYAEASSGSGTMQVEYPVSITVADRDPQMEITTEESVDGVATNGTVELVNGLENEITDVEVTVDGTGVEMIESRNILASVDSGASAEIPFRFRPTAAGEHELTATLNYTVAGTTDRTTTYSSSIQTDSLQDNVRLNATPIGDRSEPDVRVEVQNFGNHEIEDVTVTATAANATFGEAVIQSIAAGESQQVRLDTTLQGSTATADVTASYGMATTDGTATATTTVESEQGRIALTGLDVTREDDGRIRVSGSASNVGSSEVDSVIVGVQDTAAVEPAFPHREYFVGTVPASDFVSFDVYAQTEPNTSSVPLEITYTSGGETRTQEASVDISSRQSTPSVADSTDTGGFSSLLVAGVGGIMMLVVGGIMVIGWRNSQDDS